MLINVINVETNKVPGKSWNQIDVAYKDSKGELKGKKLMSFAVKEGLPILTSAKQGDVLDITVVQENNFWNWTKVAKAEAGAQAAAPASTSKGSYSVPSRDFETAAERAIKQVYIVRQSSITAAINYYSNLKNQDASVSDILKLAKHFENFVFAKEEELPAFEEHASDEAEVA